MPHPPLAVPSVGRGSEKGIAATIDAYRAVGRDAAARGIETFVVISPHAPTFRDAIALFDTDVLSGDMRQFRAPQEKLDFPVDRNLVKDIINREANAAAYRIKPEIDHGAFVPLYYATEELRRAGKPISIVLMGFSFQPLHTLFEAGRAIRRACEAAANTDRIAIIASGDLSHHLTKDGPYPFNPKGAVFDALIVDIIKRGAFNEFIDIDEGLIEEAGQCGHRSFVMLAGMCEGKPASSKVLSYEGPFGVGYCVAMGEF